MEIGEAGGQRKETGQLNGQKVNIMTVLSEDADQNEEEGGRDKTARYREMVHRASITAAGVEVRRASLLHLMVIRQPPAWLGEKAEEEETFYQPKFWFMVRINLE